MISQCPQFHKSLRLAVRDDTVVVFFTLQKIEEAKCAVSVQLARSIVYRRGKYGGREAAASLEFFCPPGPSLPPPDT